MQEEYSATTKMHQRGEWRDFSKPRKCSSHPFGLLVQYCAWCLRVKLLLLLKDRRFGLRLKRVHLAVGSDVLAEQVLSLVLSNYSVGPCYQDQLLHHFTEHGNRGTVTFMYFQSLLVSQLTF